MTDLEQHIQATSLIDTHEHLAKETKYVNEGPDVLQDLFDNYVIDDLVVAGASPEAVQRLIDSTDPDVAARWTGVSKAWKLCRHTGYGQAVQLIARQVYSMEEITLSAIEAASEKNLARRQPGERLRILREEGNLDHVQVDDWSWVCEPDPSGPEFFLYDLSWLEFCNGEIDSSALHEQVGVDVRGLASLREAMEALFAKYAPFAIAVKSQHAYDRALRWQAPDESVAERALQKQLRDQELVEAEQLNLGDWCWARGVELAVQHDLPFKVHTGYCAGHSRMLVERMRPGHLCELLQYYPQARFVLMHIAYPYNNELVALAKHYPNVYVDMCWVWGIDPYTASEFLRSMIHAVPINKLFAFGGDSDWPSPIVAYAIQARAWLNRTLQAEIDDELLTEIEAMAMATRIMRDNQHDCFGLSGKQATIRKALTPS